MFKFILLVAQAVLTVQQQYSDPSDGLPPTPVLPVPNVSGYVNLSAVDIWYAQFGTPLSKTLAKGQSPVVFLHGAFGNSDYFGQQISYLLEETDASIISIDSRMQGRSTGVDGSINYSLMREDVVGVLDHFGVPKATVIGWSDGGIIGLNMAMYAPSRLDRLFAFAASYSFKNTAPGFLTAPNWVEYLKRTKQEYHELSPTPHRLPTQREKINRMLEVLPKYSKADLGRIPTLSENCTTSPFIWVVDGANEEILKYGVARKIHNWIADSGLVILPSVSHFAFIQDAETFNVMIKRFLDTSINCV